MEKKVGLFIFVFLFSFHSVHVGAWDNIVTHRDLSEKAAEHAIIDPFKGNYLYSLGFANGLEEEVVLYGESKSIRRWIRAGAKDEDYATLWTTLIQEAPFYNHFHNPLKTRDQWNQAGLYDYVGFLPVSGESSVLWAMNTNDNDWTWQAVNGFYYSALTSATEAERQADFARTFKGLGHLIHLIQDAAQPAHVRNDAHPLDGMGIMESLETWAKNNRDPVNNFASAPSFPTVSLASSLGGYPTVAQFWDTDQYSGSNPSTSLSLGLAEYTNANFASDDTLFTEGFDPSHRKYFPYPGRAGMVEFAEDVSSGNGVYRTYFRKVSDGETINHFAMTGRFYRYLSSWPEIQRNFISLDERCHEDYAEKLIPRAVGYSAALINYFFRGKLDYMVDAGDRVDGVKGIKVLNLSDEEMAGDFSLYYDTADGTRHFLGRWNLVIAPQGLSPVLSFSFPADNIETHRYIVVFRGGMGAETDAVAGYIHGAGWREEWDGGLLDNHNWVNSETDLVGQNPGNGITINQVITGKLVKENIREAGSAMARVNETYIGLADSVSSGTYYLGGYAIPYDFTDQFPLRITPETWLSFKIDAMSIDEPIPAQSCAMEWPTGDYQGISLEFQLGDGSIRKVVFTVPGHENYLWSTLLIAAGQDYSVNLHDLLEGSGNFVEPVQLNSVNIVQQMLPLCDPSAIEHHQSMEVDYIRIERR